MRGHKLYRVDENDKGQVYEARRGCKSCPLRKKCMLSQAAKRDYKRLTMDIEAEKYRRRSEALITSDKGVEIFSLLKAAFGYRRFRTHGMRNIETEWMILCMAGNALRYSIRLANERAGTPFWFKKDKEKAS